MVGATLPPSAHRKGHPALKTNRNHQMQAMMRQYRVESGETDIDMHEVAKWAAAKGWALPRPADPLDRLAAQFAQAAREETRHDEVTGRPYRANHAYPVPSANGQQLYLWIDIDDAPRVPMLKSVINRREQVVGDVVQLTFDAEHWNRINPSEEPIIVAADFTDDVAWRKASEDQEEQKGA